MKYASSKEKFQNEYKNDWQEQHVIINRLDKYIFSQSVKPLIVMTLCVTAIVWLTQILQKSEIMVEDGGSFAAFLQISLLIIPNLLAVITPFTLFAAVLYTLNRLKTDSELPVFSATGASTIRIARPLLFVALLGTAFSYLLNVDFMPRSYRVMKQTVYEIRNDIAHTLVRSGVFTQFDDGIMIYAEQVRPGGQFLGVMIYDQRDPRQPITYMAEKGLYQNTDKGPKLHLARGTIQRPELDSNLIDIARFDETAVDLKPYQKSTNLAYLEGTERFISELLYPDLEKAYDLEQKDILIAEGHARLATPLNNILFALIAMLALLKGGFNRNGYSSRISLAILSVIILRVFGFALQNIAADYPVLNATQYGLPILGIIICSILLIGNPRLGLKRNMNRSAQQVEC